MAEQNKQLNQLTVADRFQIFEQLNLHQRYIDNDGSRESAEKYVSLYWPEATFKVNDIRTNLFEGPAGLKQLYDYAHSVFPLEKMRHALGTFVIEGSGNSASVEWNWIVTWKAEKQGFVSTGTYTDTFEKRDGVWKCLSRISDVDPNWPVALFQPWVDQQDKTYKAS
ncbi:nuclear transport factor 2 family protein [Massilia sp. MB5]|uniref:nuclear transport factor 2 family protein n=1 Tax=Massilia sp. MB5 TaxID=2919578 RepID=UPI001F0D96AA|nr:nuclear transport factor 2 family protein [Massilia sp. MB5]UMR32424.1 nuclear transport factor 2 family protein [Massilia sp. MB5]